MIVEWLPWINLILGVLSLWGVYALYQWAHLTNSVVNQLNTLSQIYGGTPAVATRWSIGIWLTLIVLAIEAVLYIVAFPATRARKKSGWDLLFYALLVNVVYGVVSAFTNYGGVGSLVSSLIGSVVGLWLLFQIRDAYLDKKSSPEAPKAS
jgi:hypothetical protein